MSRNGFMLNNGLYLAWMVAFTAMLGSLYFSEVLEYVPCELCWYQRILMYPLAIILAIAAVRKDHGITTYVIPISFLGMMFGTYHYLLEKTNLFADSSLFCGITPCDIEYINWFGFITIPFLSLTAFTMIFIISILIRRAEKRSRNTFRFNF